MNLTSRGVFFFFHFFTVVKVPVETRPTSHRLYFVLSVRLKCPVEVIKDIVFKL